eukprot:2940942-Rhodomonas_salina.1
MQFFIEVPVSTVDSEVVEHYTLVVGLELCLDLFLALRDCSSSVVGTSSRSLPNHGAWTCGEIVVNSSVSRQVYWIYKQRVPKGKKRSFSTLLVESLKAQLRVEGVIAFDHFAKDYFTDNVVILH